jgi:hypothetical protein
VGALSILEEAVTMRVAFGLVLGTMLLAGSAVAAGPFDGTWKGETSAVNMARNQGCPVATLNATIADGKLTGLFSDGQNKYPFKATVQADGTLVDAFMGRVPLTGKITGNEFVANYTSTGCEGKPRQMTMHKTG